MKDGGRGRGNHTTAIEGDYGELAAPDALLGVEGGEHNGFVVDAGGVAIDGGGGLGAEVAVAGVEVEGADVVGAVGAGELHAYLDGCRELSQRPGQRQRNRACPELVKGSVRSTRASLRCAEQSRRLFLRDYLVGRGGVLN